ncbi:MAG: restriction endonuclease [Deltaproteobacteria bacterium]|nr:MAG: restriction endonuclease [Deltaproteobacteria bacterium]
MLVATCVGVVLILLLVAAGPNPAAAGIAGRPAPEGTDLAGGDAWLAGLSREEFTRLLARLFEELGFEITPLESGAGEAVLLIAEDPTPIRGVKMLVWGQPLAPAGALGAEVVREAMEMVRGEDAGKGVVVTPGRFTAEARTLAASLPIDLLDGRALLEQVKKKLPQVAAQKQV